VADVIKLLVELGTVGCNQSDQITLWKKPAQNEAQYFFRLHISYIIFSSTYTYILEYIFFLDPRSFDLSILKIYLKIGILIGIHIYTHIHIGIHIFLGPRSFEFILFKKAIPRRD
jgi:hypothetical protein